MIHSKTLNLRNEEIWPRIFSAIMLAGVTLGWIPVLALGLKNNNTAMVAGGSVWCAIFGLGCLAFGKHSLPFLARPSSAGQIGFLLQHA
jgi:hypothetical protein